MRGRQVPEASAEKTGGTGGKRSQKIPHIHGSEILGKIRSAKKGGPALKNRLAKKRRELGNPAFPGTKGEAGERKTTKRRRKSAKIRG